VVEPTGSSAGECPIWLAACEMRLGSEGHRGTGKVRRRRGRRRLLMARLLLLLRRLFYGFLRCCFLRRHVISTSLRCQNIERCVSGISEFVERVHFSLLDVSVGWKRVPETFSFYGELEARPLRASMDGDARCARRQAERTRRATRGLDSTLDRHPHSARRLVRSPLCAWNDHRFIVGGP
jgi:hypothetical protein